MLEPIMGVPILSWVIKAVGHTVCWISQQPEEVVQGALAVLGVPC